MKINKQDIKPVGARCLIEVYKEAEKTTSGLYRAEKEFESTPVIGMVYRAGDKSAYKEGQTVMFRRYSLDELKFNEDAEEFVISLVEDEEIVCIVEPSSV